MFIVKVILNFKIHFKFKINEINENKNKHKKCEMLKHYLSFEIKKKHNQVVSIVYKKRK